ncbi:MAG TPA: response regulator [Solirubrobacterales bacterium]|nr:response regulator [Solirubrobacterales bacterium]
MRRVLLVDDDPAIREIARISLERVGEWTVTSASSGLMAVELAEGEPPFDAVLLDVMMPGLDGPRTLALLRERAAVGPATPAVFFTAKLQPADRERLHRIGAAGVIAKPFDPMGLAAELDAIVDGERDGP